jgi:hypothetical protein
VNKGCPFVLVFRMKHGLHAVAAAQRFVQVNRLVNGTANVQTFIPVLATSDIRSKTEQQTAT